MKPYLTPRLIAGVAATAMLGFAQAPTHWQQAWDSLRSGLQESDANHRKEALVAMGTMASLPEAVQRGAVQIAKEGLQDKDTLVRQTAATSLGQMGSPDAIPYLKEALDDGPEVSFSAAKALWDLGDKDGARQIFQEVIEGERSGGPTRATALKREAKKKLRPEELALMGVKEAGMVLGPGSIGITAAEESLKAAKKGGGAPGRIVAAEILAKDPEPYALTLLEWALGDNSPLVRVAVAKALGERGNQETIAKLLPLLSDDRHAVRYMAAASIIKLSSGAVQAELEIRSGEKTSNP
jgi:HEAT repeat protein